jgi:hypothetical protein
MDFIMFLVAFTSVTGQIPADCDAATRTEYVNACFRAYPGDKYGWDIETTHNLTCCLQDEEPFEDCVAQCEFSNTYFMREKFKECKKKCERASSLERFGITPDTSPDAHNINNAPLTLIENCKQKCHDAHKSEKDAMIARCKKRDEENAVWRAQKAHNKQQQQKAQRTSNQNRLMTLRHKPKR